MQCNRDEECKRIADKFQSARNEINPSFTKVSSDIGYVNEELYNLESKVPMDSATYLGKKVVEELKKIEDGITEYQTDIDNKKKAMNKYIDLEINKHNMHYDNWLEEQSKEKEKEKTETKTETQTKTQKNSPKNNISSPKVSNSKSFDKIM